MKPFTGRARAEGDRGRRRAPVGVDRLAAARAQHARRRDGAVRPRPPDRPRSRSKAQEYGFAYDVDATRPRRPARAAVPDPHRAQGHGQARRGARVRAEGGEAGVPRLRRGDLRGQRGVPQELREGRVRRRASSASTRAPKRSPSMVQFSKDFDFDSTDMYLFHELDKIAKFDVAQVGARRQEGARLGQGRHRRRQAEHEGHQGRQALEGEVRRRRATPRSPIRRSIRAKRSARSRTPVSSRTSPARSASSSATAWTSCCCRSHAMPLAAASLIFKNAGDASTPTNPLARGDRPPRCCAQPPTDAEVFRARPASSIGCGTSDDAMTCRTHGINIYLDVMLKGLERMIKAGDVHAKKAIEAWQKSVQGGLQAQEHAGRERVHPPGRHGALRPRPPVHEDRDRDAGRRRQGPQGHPRRLPQATTTPRATRR